MDDASLDEFVGSGSDGDGGDAADADPAESKQEPAEADEPEAGAEEAGEDERGADLPTDPTPATVTYQWTPDSECAACGEPVARRWQDDGAMVCEDCKVW